MIGVGIFTIVLCTVVEKSVSTGDISPFIISGRQADNNKFPWQLSYELRENLKWTHTCGATLIHARFALTASHCVYDPNKKNPDGTYQRARDFDMRVIAGVHRISPRDKDAEVHYVRKARTPFGFSGIFDIAVLELWQPVNVSRSDITPIAIANLYDPLVGRQCTITGWGATSRVRPRTSPVLREGNMRVISLDECRSSGWRVYLFQLCATGSPRSVTSCYGDSGGPLTCTRDDGTPIVAGISSFTYKNCGTARPHVFVNIATLRPWLRNVTNIADL